MKYLLILLFVLCSSFAQAESIKCYTKNEVGEMSSGEQYIFERTNELNKSKPTVIDLDKLKIINADTGESSDLIKVNENYFKSGNYHYLINDKRSAVIEASFGFSVGKDLVYSKILMCE